MAREFALYVITRRDLPKSQQAVQAGHALAQHLLEHRNNLSWTNGTLVYLGVKNEQELLSLKTQNPNLKFSEFREPDLNDQLTALAILGEEAESMFPNLKLL